MKIQLVDDNRVVTLDSSDVPRLLDDSGLVTGAQYEAHGIAVRMTLMETHDFLSAWAWRMLHPLDRSVLSSLEAVVKRIADRLADEKKAKEEAT
jgi:hypothetical protein